MRRSGEGSASSSRSGHLSSRLDTGLERHRREWEDLAGRDPLWAILSYRRYKFGRWDPDEFNATGLRQGANLAYRCRALGRPERRDRALDFGCGVGRLAPALSASFGDYVGVDISETMVAQARRQHASLPNCRFVAEADDRLTAWADRSFDLVYSFHVLQHLDSTSTILAYVASLLRVLAAGGLWVVQVPERVPKPERLAYDARRDLYARLAAAGVPSALLYRLGLFPMTMNSVPEAHVLALIDEAGARVLDIKESRVGIAIGDRTYYVTRDR